MIGFPKAEYQKIFLESSESVTDKVISVITGTERTPMQENHERITF